MPKRYGLQVEKGEGLVFVTEEDAPQILGVVKDGRVLDWLLLMPKDESQIPRFTGSEAAALVEEVTAKTWEMAKARTAKLIEVLCPDRRNEWKNGLNNETASLLGILLNDVCDAAREVVRRRAPEITTDMIRAAQENRMKEAAQDRVVNLQERVTGLEEELQAAKRDLERATARANGNASSVGLPVPKA